MNINPICGMDTHGTCSIEHDHESEGRMQRLLWKVRKFLRKPEN